MSPFLSVPIAWRALGSNRLRSTLTMLGVIIGVGAVIVMVAIGSGARAQIEERIATLGENIVLVTPGSQASGGVRAGTGSAQSLTVEDGEALLTDCPSLSASSPVLEKTLQVIARNQNWYTHVQGVSASYLEIRSWPLEAGESFNEQHLKGSAKVCLLGATVVEKLFGSDDPEGDYVRIAGVPLKVIGVLSRKGQSARGADQDDVVLVPVTTQLQRLYKKNRLTSIIAVARDGTALRAAEEEVAGLLRQRHKIGNPEEDDFTVRSQEEIVAAATATSRTLGALLASVAAVSLLVGGIGIMNIMLVSVTERTREIGIRRAVGARGLDILVQFLVEALVLAFLGGLVGVALGIGGSHALASAEGWPVLISAPSILLAFLFAGAVGIFFGFYPAYKAAELETIDALRYE
ncbi:MAG TPA: ABC transporter permease [Thermoanaerobaculia bacterium]|nr:ABC transporter permease [Thermoanaerobaculia bacterium]